MATPTGLNTPTHEIAPFGVQEIPATGKHRFVCALGNQNYVWGNGTTQPTSGWTPHVTTLNDGFNFPDEMGTIWIYNPNSATLNINVHEGV